MGSFGFLLIRVRRGSAQHPPCSPFGPLMYPPPHPGGSATSDDRGSRSNPLTRQDFRTIRFLIHSSFHHWCDKWGLPHADPYAVVFLGQIALPATGTFLFAVAFIRFGSTPLAIGVLPFGFALRLDVEERLVQIGPTTRNARVPSINGHFVPQSVAGTQSAMQASSRSGCRVNANSRPRTPPYPTFYVKMARNSVGLIPAFIAMASRIGAKYALNHTRKNGGVLHRTDRVAKSTERLFRIMQQNREQHFRIRHTTVTRGSWARQRCCASTCSSSVCRGQTWATTARRIPGIRDAPIAMSDHSKSSGRGPKRCHSLPLASNIETFSSASSSLISFIRGPLTHRHSLARLHDEPAAIAPRTRRRILRMCHARFVVPRTPRCFGNRSPQWHRASSFFSANSFHLASRFARVVDILIAASTRSRGLRENPCAPVLFEMDPVRRSPATQACWPDVPKLRVRQTLVG